MMRRPGFYLQLAFTLLVCAFLIVPVLMSILAGLTHNYFLGVASGLTLDWVAKVWELYAETIYRSIGIALACLAVTLVLGVPAAYVLAKRQTALTRAIEELLVMPVAVPGLATALALIVTFGGLRDLRTSSLFILIGHVLFTLPFMVRSVLAVMSSIDLNTLEESAATLGASFVQRFFGVVLPNCRSGILAGALMVVTLSIGEFNMTWLLHTPLTKTLPVGLADSYASMRLEIGSAYTLVFFLMIMPLLIALQAVSTPRRKKPLPQDTAPGIAP
jgi:putative spermidine/putrescine transport system permease protein